MGIQISIVIATWNAAKTLVNCLNSIIPQLNEECELIVIDGGSKDSTNEIIASYGEKVSFTISEKDKGIYDAWNKGIKASRGQWILFIGADDRLADDAIVNYLNFIKSVDTDTDFISSKIDYVDELGNTLVLTGKLWNYNRCRINMDVTHVASLTNKNYFNRVGMFNVDYKIVGDYELLMRGGKDMKSAFMNKIVATMAIGGASFSTKALKEQFRVKRNVAHMPWVLCAMIYCVQLFLFYTYKIRH